MEPLGFRVMGGKGKFIRIRADDVLKAALSKSAAVHVRQEADEARYLLMKVLGLLEQDEVVNGRDPPGQKNQGRS